MFKSSSIEQELMQSMEKQLMIKRADDKGGFNKLAKAIDYLNAAAHIFDQVNFVEESEDITKILASLAEE